MDTLRQDLRFALRLLWTDRAFAATAVLTLALCIGANAAIFTVVQSVLLRPLPYPEPERLVFLTDRFPGVGIDRAGTSVPNYLDRLTSVTALDSQALYQFNGLAIGEGVGAESVAGLSVTPSLFRVLRVSPHRGRAFTEDDSREGRDRVAILSFGYWLRVFAGNPDVLGREIRINGERYTIVGVMSDGFTFLKHDVAVWRPLSFSAPERSEGQTYRQDHDQIARLAAGTTLEQAQQQINALTERNYQTAGALKPILVNADYHTTVVLLADDIVRNVRRTLHLLWAGVLFVLLIGAANITNLVLVRATARMKELATRQALGAGHGRLARQLVTETLLLTVIGGALGLVLGSWCLSLVSLLGLTELPRGHEIRMDWIVVAVVIGLTLAQGLIISVVPLAHLAGLKLNVVWHEDSRTGTASRGSGFARRSLVAIQVALAFLLLVGAGLLFASFRQLLAVDTGFKADRVLTGVINLPQATYGDAARRSDFVNRALDRIHQLPGVAAVGATNALPFGSGAGSRVILPEGYVMAPGVSVISPNSLRVTPGYVEALGVTLKQGRFFAESDTATAPRVVIVDERLAQRFWPNADPIGRRMYEPQLGRPDEFVKPGPDTTWLQVVGVVGAIKQQELLEGEQSRLGAYYFPYAQNPRSTVGFAIKTTADPLQIVNGVRQTLADLDPQLLFSDVKPLEDRVEASLQPRETPMMLSLAFGALALMLAAVGIYGVLAFQVSQRTREIGIRIALGSDGGSILRLILREGAVLVFVGLVIGVAATVALRQVIASQLYGVGALDPVVLASVSAVLTLAAFLACLVPASRAARVDPVVALTRQ